ncbi:hypothetical protein BD414DRAFT_531404 [Trametes punicea]|nr:hypothetical protein BD414DRAFT_531404 [Trametes punicea]
MSSFGWLVPQAALLSDFNMGWGSDFPGTDSSLHVGEERPRSRSTTISHTLKVRHICMVLPWELPVPAFQAFTAAADRLGVLCSDAVIYAFSVVDDNTLESFETSSGSCLM